MTAIDTNRPPVPSDEPFNRVERHPVTREECGACGGERVIGGLVVGDTVVDEPCRACCPSQPRERAVPCVWCHQPTLAVDLVCDDPSCQAREQQFRARAAARIVPSRRSWEAPTPPADQMPDRGDIPTGHPPAGDVTR